MASLIAKADIEAELQISLPSGYADLSITNICNWADSTLKLRTNRTAFTGLSADLAKHAEICLAVDRLTTSNRDLVKVAIQSISENGANIIFSNGKTLASYKEEAAQYIKDLRIPGTKDWGLTFADPDNEHTGDESSLFY